MSCHTVGITTFAVCSTDRHCTMFCSQCLILCCRYFPSRFTFHKSSRSPQQRVFFTNKLSVYTSNKLSMTITLLSHVLLRSFLIQVLYVLLSFFVTSFFCVQLNSFSTVSAALIVECISDLFSGFYSIYKPVFLIFVFQVFCSIDCSSQPGFGSCT